MTKTASIASVLIDWLKQEFDVDAKEYEPMGGVGTIRWKNWNLFSLPGRLIPPGNEIQLFTITETSTMEEYGIWVKFNLADPNVFEAMKKPMKTFIDYINKKHDTHT